ncbi:MAG: SGNH/GDSL hydrolase family protein, partial [Verrucomicrobiales bacterium]
MKKNPLRSILCSLALAVLAPSVGQAEFAFEQGDHVVYIGNSLADRMQHDGWLETILQSQLAGEKLVFRNLGYSGDEIVKRPRSKDFATPEDYLEICAADVIFCFFGYNESFGGDEGLARFKTDYAAMIDAYRELNPNGVAPPRFVLFSPIAHEDLKDANLPDGVENNARLAKYTQAIAQVAADKSVEFVDLFAASQKLYGGAEEALTINGIHLNEEGNRLLAEVMAGELLGENVSSSSAPKKLREAVLDKNLHWFHRYRATDGNDVWGGRSTLEFVNGQTNAEVLQHELTMFDVMTANRDANVWAAAAGSEFAVDDSNVPAPIPVISNVGGGSKSSNAEKEGSLEYLGGEAVLDTLTVPE